MYVRYEHFAFHLKSSFSPVVKTTSDGKQSVRTLMMTRRNFNKGWLNSNNSSSLREALSDSAIDDEDWGNEDIQAQDLDEGGAWC